MYTDILDQVTGGGSGGGVTGRGGRGGGGRGNNRSTTTADSEEIIVRFKAGRMVLNKDAAETVNDTTTGTAANPSATGISDVSSTDDDATTAPEAVSSNDNKENVSKFHCVALQDRGEVRLVKTTSSATAIPSYSWQWYNRTHESVDETIHLLPATTKHRHSFERVTLPSKKVHELDRVFVWTRIPSKKETLLEEQQQPKYRMYWMQDADPSTDVTIVASVNQFFADVAAAAKIAITTAAATASSSATTTTTTASQVDALSSILENLGMPQTATNSATSMDATTTGVDPPAASTTTSTGRNQLTLADLQGAMASIQQQQQQQVNTVGPPLQDLVTTQSIDALMNNPEACQRLIQYLPEEQQSMEFLRENLTSSSLQSTLRTLTQMLVQQDDDGNNTYTEYSNIVANFQLDPQDGETALLQNNNPIEAFLNCIIASVEKETDIEATTTAAADEDAATPSDGTQQNEANKDGDDSDGDVQMNE